MVQIFNVGMHDITSDAGVDLLQNVAMP